jgi:hypothetical protein
MRSLPGLNIQFPISQEIINGNKSIETRTYPIPKHYLGVPIFLVETPGPSGRFKARISGIVVVSRCRSYKSKKDFYADQSLHLVSPNSPWKWTDKKPKWGWTISKVIRIKKTIPLKKRTGIVFTKQLPLPDYLLPELELLVADKQSL